MNAPSASAPASTAPTPTATASSTPAWPLRVARVLALLGLSAALSLVLGLAIFSSSPTFHSAFSALIQWESQGEGARTAGLLTLGLVALVTSALLVLSWRLKLRSWWWIAGGYLALAPVYVYLATDDPAILHPITLEEISPAFPGAEKGYEVLMRYGKGHPLGKNFVHPPSVLAGKSALEPGPWRETILQHRAAFEARWIEIAPVRTWWAEVNTFDRLADLVPAGPHTEILAYSPCRAISQTGCAIATLRALDGHGDEAIDILIPLIEVARKLQPSGRTLVRLMIGVVVERMALETASFVLDTTPVSAATRARLAAATRPGNAELAARRILVVEYANSLGGVRDMPLAEMLNLYTNHRSLGTLVNALSPFLYNPRASYNLYGELYADLQEMLARRDIAKMSAREQQFWDAHPPQFKNFLGTLIMRMAIPAYTKVGESFWKMQDVRTKLHARLTAP